MRAFLIDFENVKSAGLVGIDTLGIDDQVVILYSVNSNTISFEMHQKIMSCAANVEYYQIRRGGKNSLDFQLSTMLGYLLASGLYTHLYIVSNDSGFDALYDFWTSGYLPTDCVVYRRPNIAMSVAHSVFTGKQIARDVSSNVEEVDVTVTDSAAYEQFEMEREDHSRTEDEKQQDIVEIVAEQLPETSSDEQSGEESAAEVDDFETAALLGALQAVQQQETENELKKSWEESDDISAAARMRQAELDAEEEESYIPAAQDAENPEPAAAAEEPTERSRRRRGRPRRSNNERAQEQQQTASAEKPRQKADPAEVAALSSRLESELADVCNREQRIAVAEEILLAEGKQEFYRGIIRRFGQKRGLLVYKAVKSDFTALKKK